MNQKAEAAVKFSFLMISSSSGVKSPVVWKYFLICSTSMFLSWEAILAEARSKRGLIINLLEVMDKSKRSSYGTSM